MKIITVPNSTLRQIAEPVTKVDKKLETLVKGLQTTLLGRKNPRGVGLAAPQVDKSKRLFVLNLSEDDKPFTHPSQLPVLINPQIVKHSQEIILGPDAEDPLFEGCLSIPGVYGPVPRWVWVEVEYQELVDGALVNRYQRYEDFPARVVQHESDHLDGILFTDYSLRLDLPVYQDTKGDFVEIKDRRVLQSW